MKKGIMIGIGMMIVVIVAVYGITLSQNTESIPGDTADKITADVSQESDVSSNYPQDAMPNESDTSTSLLQNCSGTAKCITGTVAKIIDGDTILVNEQSVRFALASAPNLEG